MLSFTGYELRAIEAVTLRAKRGIPLESLQTLKSLNICSVAKTHEDAQLELIPFDRSRQSRVIGSFLKFHYLLLMMSIFLHWSHYNTASSARPRQQCNVSADVATVTMSPFVPNNTPFKQNSLWLDQNNRDQKSISHRPEWATP